MTPERWQRIEELYHAALERPSNERAAWLASACGEGCGDDAELRREVELLLAANDQASGFLTAPALQLAAQSLAADERPTQPLGLAIGQQLSHYKILSRIGAGGMGEVYLARDASLERRVALKLLPLRFTRDAERLQRFVREAKAASALNHPNIITIYEIGVVDSENGRTHFIATEYIEGVTLRAWEPEEDQRLSQTLEFGSQIASALDAAHHAGIVHRDIKPENLMVRPDGLVKVLDFGLAKLTAPQTSGANQVDTNAQTLPEPMKTQPGIILGTLRYMSPEQARGRALDARTDIFSLGVVLYELLTRKPLFKGETSADVIAAIIHKEPAPLSTYLPEAPAELERILRKALAKDSRDRYQDARDLQIDLQTLKQESELSARLARSERSNAANSGAVAAQTAGVMVAPRFTFRQGLLVLPAVILLIGTLWWWLAGRERIVEAPPPGSLKTTEVITWQSVPGEGSGTGTFSPDGKLVAFTSTKGGSKSIWVKLATSGDAEQSTKGEFINGNPIWSPNGEEIAYVSLRADQIGIWRKPPLGGAPALLKTFLKSENNLQLQCWSRNGAKIYYVLNRNLFALDVSSGATKQLTDLGPAKANQNSISISPDEQHIAYSSSDKPGAILWTAPVRGGAPKQVARLSAGVGRTVWHSDSNRILFSMSIDGTHQIFVADLAGHQPAQLTFGDRDISVLDVSLDGTRVLYDSSIEESNLWGVQVAKAEEFAVASEIGFEFWPDVSPDNRTVAYQNVRSMSQGNNVHLSSILTKSIASPDKPVALIKEGVWPKWAPNGKQLAFMRMQGNLYSLWTANVSSGGEKQLAKGVLFGVDYTVLPYNRLLTNNFDWSPDSSKLVYSMATNGYYDLWIVAADGSSQTQITSHSSPELGVNCPFWSADGRRLSYLSRQIGADGKTAYGIWLNEVAAKNSKPVYQANTFLRLLGWSRTDKELLFARGQAGALIMLPSAIKLLRLSITTGEQNVIAVLPNTYLHNIYLSADKQIIAFVSRQEGKDNLWVLPAAGGVARKLTGNNDSRLYFSSLAWAPDGQAIYFGKQTKHNLIAMLTNFK